MFLFVVLLAIVVYILAVTYREEKIKIKDKYDYKWCLLTVNSAKTRQ